VLIFVRRVPSSVAWTDDPAARPRKYLLFHLSSKAGAAAGPNTAAFDQRWNRWTTAGLALSGDLVRRSPFRAPHHGASDVSVIGAGTSWKPPGEISLAHTGVLSGGLASDRKAGAPASLVELGPIKLGVRRWEAGVAPFPPSGAATRVRHQNDQGSGLCHSRLSSIPHQLPTFGQRPLEVEQSRLACLTIAWPL
jgi:hypothetical protein